MKLKELLPLLPRYDDDSGWDFTIRISNDKSRWRWERVSILDGIPGEMLSAEVKEICYGWPKVNGGWDYRVNVVV